MTSIKPEDWPKLPKSQDEALSWGAMSGKTPSLYYDGKHCRYGHDAPRHTADRVCTVYHEEKPAADKAASAAAAAARLAKRTPPPVRPDALAQIAADAARFGAGRGQLIEAALIIAAAILKR